jgi:hypothetical protein
MKIREQEMVYTPEEIAAQMNERRPLPMGRTEFDEWSARIISGANVTATAESQKFVLADCILHLGPQESHKEDAYFIHTLRKMAVNQVSVAIRDEIKAANTARAEAAKAEAEATPAAESTSGNA